MWVSALSRARWTVQAEICVGSAVHAAATQQGYFADLQTLRPIRIPDRLRAAWEAARAP